MISIRMGLICQEKIVIIFLKKLENEAVFRRHKENGGFVWGKKEVYGKGW